MGIVGEHIISVKTDTEYLSFSSEKFV